MRTHLIELTPLTVDRIEEVRLIRNESVGQKVLRDDRWVTAEQHRKWYEALPKEENRIYLVDGIVDKRALGYVACFSRGFDPGVAEIGIFIKSDCTALLVPCHAKILLILHAFQDLSMARLIAYFRSENLKAIRFNASLGFVEVRRNTREVVTQLDHVRFWEWFPKYHRVLDRGAA